VVELDGEGTHGVLTRLLFQSADVDRTIFVFLTLKREKFDALIVLDYCVAFFRRVLLQDFAVEHHDPFPVSKRLALQTLVGLLKPLNRVGWCDN